MSRAWALPVVFGIVFFFSATAFASVEFDPDPLLHRADSLLDQGRVLESLALYDEVARQSADPEVRAANLVKVADILALFLEQQNLALEYYGQAIAEYPQSPALENAYFGSGMLLYEMRRLEESRERFAVFAERFPDSIRIETVRFMLERIAEELAAGPVEPPPDGVEPFRLDAEPMVRVALGRGQTIRLEFSGQAVAEGTRDSVVLEPGEQEFSLYGGSLAVAGKDLGERAVVREGTGQGFYYKGVRYLGEAVLLARGQSILLVNRLAMESYLLGVVPREMPVSFEEQALQAQAVAARSYACALLEVSRGRDYDVSADTSSQVYGGADVATDKVRRAVEATRGRMLTHAGRPVLSYFHSHSGGVLEDDAMVWATDLPYYTVAQDPVSQETKAMDWEFRISGKKLAKILRANGFHVPSVQGIEAAERSPSGRLAVVRVLTPDGPVDIQSNNFRLMAGAGDLKSTFFDVKQQGETYIFKGRGFGHGVGMSQWGAQGWAEEGAGYAEILARYYPGTYLECMY